MAKVIHTTAVTDGEEVKHGSLAPPVSAVGMGEYFDRSAKVCIFNNVWPCCTCRCLGLLTVIVWLYIGVAKAILSVVVLSRQLTPCTLCPEAEPEEPEIFDWSEYPESPDGFFGDGCNFWFPDDFCCLVGDDLVTMPCQAIETGSSINLVQGILQVVVSILGIVAFVRYISLLLWAPIAYPVINVILYIVFLSLYNLYILYLPGIIGLIWVIVISFFFILILIHNLKIMKATLHR